MTGPLLRVTFVSKDLWLIYVAGIAATYALWMLGANCTINFIGGLLSPWLTGVVKDQTGSFSAGCHLASILLAAAVLCLSL